MNIRIPDMKFDMSRLYLIDKVDLANALFYMGMLTAFLGSMNPWFMWSLSTLYPVPACLFLLASLLLMRNSSNSFYVRNDYLLPFIAYVALGFYERLTSGSNINGYIAMFFRFVVFYSIFKVSTERFRGFITFTCKFLGVLLSFSLSAHILYILGFPMPGGATVTFGEFYSYSNHYFFLLDDRNLFTLVPRFCSVFLEPSHIGAVCAFLLITQIGHWRRWYNIVLMATLFFTFSLAAYALFLVGLFIRLWVLRKKIIRKILITLALIGAAVVTTFTYNGGDNLVNNLIMMRLEMDDGEMAGDNRVTVNFEAEYDKFVQTSDVIFGREMDNSEFGNSGYRVFIYEFGLVGLFLLIAFYASSFMGATDRRAMLSAAFLAFLYFWAEAKMLWECVYIPLYAIAYLNYQKKSQ